MLTEEERQTDGRKKLPSTEASRMKKGWILHVLISPGRHRPRRKMFPMRKCFLRKEYVPSHQQCADIFTKALGNGRFTFSKTKLGLWDLHAPV
ncbi:unnamed protein product [Victoria cruziana]